MVTNGATYMNQVVSNPVGGAARLQFWSFALAVLAIWMAFAVFMGLPIFQHGDTDQQTLQALAWRNGHANLDWNDPNIEANKNWLELAQFNGHVYNSFPATPTLIELPLTMIWGDRTPNTMVMLLFCWAAFLLGYGILHHYTKDRVLSIFVAAGFFFGTQILYASLEATVHYQGHIYAVFFSLLAIFIAIKARRAWQLIFAGLAIGLAIGCRPFQFCLIPVIVALAQNRFPLWKVLIYGFIGLVPVGAALAWYNWLRFGNITEFGHIYLPLHRVYHRGPQFGLRYFGFNASHWLTELPSVDKATGLLNFNGYGSAFWLTSPFTVLALWYFVKKDVPILERLVVGLCYVAMQFGLLLHESNGWFQFGYRYLIDIVPLFLFMFARAYKRLGYWMIPIGIWAIIINVYGVYWKDFSPLGYPHEAMIFY